jgi:hypothetical protein
VDQRHRGAGGHDAFPTNGLIPEKRPKQRIEAGSRARLPSRPKL